MSEAWLAWEALDAAWKASYEEAWASWSAGCFGIGCAVVDGQGSIVARGRNRVMERASAPGVLAESLIAHAEMNALAVLPLDRGTGEDLALYTTMEPCLMCATAVVMVRIGQVHFAAADPMFEGLHDALMGYPYCTDRMPGRHGPLAGPIGVFAELLPLSFNMTWTPHGRWMRLHESLFPERHRVARSISESGRLAIVVAERGTVTDALDAIWDELTSLSS